ncbi:MAG: PAS domain S-box protein [Pseudomonadales bacterium]
MFGVDGELIDKDDLTVMAVEASPNGMVMVNQDGIMLLVNGAIERTFGYRRQELVGRSLDMLIPTRYRAEHPKLRDRFFTQPSTRAMGAGRDLFALHKEGYEFPVEIGLNPFEFQGQTLVLAAIVDITERHKATEMISLAVEAAPNGMIMTDASGKITLVNQFAEQLFGYARRELIGQNISVLVPDKYQGEHPDLVVGYCRRPVARAMGHGRDLYGRCKDGTEIAVEIALNPINTLQGPMVLASIVDISERKKHEESLLSALKEKEILLTEIHHRVKNNLQIIDSLLGMQADGIESDSVIAALKESQGRIKSMALIHQTLYQSTDLSQVNMSDVVMKIAESLMMSYSHSNIAMDLDSINLPLDISIPLGLIVNELVSNALKHAYANGENGEVRITLQKQAAGGVKLSVQDDGIGLEDGFDIEASATLGLSLVSALTGQISGELAINPQKPTAFNVEFKGAI